MGETTLTDDLFGLVNFPFKSKIREHTFELALARKSQWFLPFPRISGSLEELNNVTRVWVHITPGSSSNIFIVIWAAICLGVIGLLITGLVTGAGELHVHPFVAFAFPAGYLTLGIISYRKTFEIGAREATSILARVLGNPDLRSA